MDQRKRIEEMEKLLNESREALDGLEKSLEDYREIREKIRRLEKYYGSDEWHQDREDDAAGKLPGDLHRGVLTEDLVYDVLTDERELVRQMAEAAAEYLG